MPDASQMRSWARQPITNWFLRQLNNKYGNLNTEWIAITTTDQLNFNRGKADVLSTIDALIQTPELFDPVVPPEEPPS